MNVYFKLYSPSSRARAKREIDVIYRGKPVGSKAVFSGDRYTFSLPPELDRVMATGQLEGEFLLAPAADLVPAPVSLVLTDRYP